MIGELAFAFTAGAAATVNPCGFALLPAFFARRLGAEDKGRHRRKAEITRALFVGAATTLGFVIVFAICGAVVMLGATWLAGLFPWAGFVIGLGLATTGLLVLSGWHVRLPQFGFVAWPLSQGVRGDLGFGAAYGAASLSCTLPIFLAVAGVSTTLGVLGSALNFGAYALGIATVLTAVSVAAALSRRSLIAAIGKPRAYLTRVAGGVLFLAGAYVAYFWSATLFAADLTTAAGVVAAGERFSGLLRSWLTGQAGQVALYLFLAFLGVLWSWMLWQRRLKASPAASRDTRARMPFGLNHLGSEPPETGLAGVADRSGCGSKYGGKS